MLRRRAMMLYGFFFFCGTFPQLIVAGLAMEDLAKTAGPAATTEVSADITTTAEGREVVAHLGDQVVLPCGVEGNDGVVWRRDDVVLPVSPFPDPNTQNVTQDSRVGMDGTALVIADVGPNDQGHYTCSAANTSTTHTLIVHDMPDQKTVTAVAGSTAHLDCPISGHAKADVLWHAKGGVIKGPSTNKRLIIAGAQPEDSGLYECTVGEASTTITLQVLYPPVVRVEEAEVFTGVYDSAVLACHVQAMPRPSVTWTRHPHLLVDRARLRQTLGPNMRYALHFPRVQEDDLGTYTCTATNHVGTASATVTLTARPTPVRFISPLQGDQEDSYTLIWEVESYAPVLTYEIAYKNKTSNPEDNDKWISLTVPGTASSSMYHSQSHTLTGLVAETLYTARVLAHNEYGDGDSSFTTFATLGYAFTVSPVTIETTSSVHIENATEVPSESDVNSYLTHDPNHNHTEAQTHHQLLEWTFVAGDAETLSATSDTPGSCNTWGVVQIFMLGLLCLFLNF